MMGGGGGYSTMKALLYFICFIHIHAFFTSFSNEDRENAVNQKIDISKSVCVCVCVRVCCVRVRACVCGVRACEGGGGG